MGPVIHHPPVAGAIPVPHGADDYDTDDGQVVDEIHNLGPVLTLQEGQTLSANEQAVFNRILYPEDSFDENRKYWADLPLWQRLKFVSKVDHQEASKEWKQFTKMFIADPLEPVRWYFRNCVLPGAGLGLEGYVLFSIGNLSALFQKVWPTCWKSHQVCNKTWVAAVDYLEICGIIVGQILVGLIGDGIGRRWGLIQDAAIMLLGLIMLIAAWGVTLDGWVICYAWSLFVYSIGVGGEYPMTATSGMESKLHSSRDDRLHRGRKVLMAFLMQGWGQFFNQVILILLLLIFHHGSGNPPYSTVAAQWTYRISFVIPAVGTLWLVYYRTYKMPNASKALQLAKKKAKVTGYDVQSLKLLFTHFSPRLFATCGAWFCNDVFFYGNKLFQSQFIAVISPGTSSIMEGWLYNLINIGVSLVGYYTATFLIDNKHYGRTWMMQLGFIMDFILFVIPAFHYEYYTRPENVHAFQAMYFLSSFFNQFGPNCVTFLVAAEVFPTPVRATAHGFSAAWGKLGALFASILYNYIDTQTKFYVVPWFGLAGMVITFLFMPDTTGLDLREQDRRWSYIRQGRVNDYHGIAIHKTHLSMWERIRGHGKYYDPELDYKQKVHEMRKEWEAKQTEKFSEDSLSSQGTTASTNEKDPHNHHVNDDDAKTIDHSSSAVYLSNPHVDNYFSRTSPAIFPQRPKEPEALDESI